MSAFTSNFASHIEAMLEWRTSLRHSPRRANHARRPLRRRERFGHQEAPARSLPAHGSLRVQQLQEALVPDRH